MNGPFCIFILIFGFINFTNAQLICDVLGLLSSTSISAECLNQMTTTCKNSELAWKFFDASSKFLIPGMTYSNVIDYGNFPQCLSIDYEDADGKIKGKFCGLSVIVANIFLTPQTEKILTDFGLGINATSVQTVPKETFSKIEKQVRDVLLPDIPFVLSKYSMCVPDACTPREVGYFYLYGHLDQFQILTYTDLTCETTESNTDLEWGDITFIVFLGFILVVMVASTIYDALCQNFKTAPHHPLLLSFSVLYNGKKLLQISNNKTEQVHCFHGMRFISMMWIVAYHAVSPFSQGALALSNYQEVAEWNANPTNRYINSALLAVDTFFFIAGFLLAFSYIKTAANQSALQQLLKVPKMYLHRYLRLTPALAAMYLVTVTIFRFLGSGPTWSLVTNLMKQTCLDRWWKFFLYIQNYTDPDNMCVNPMWYLSADMQMFILAPIVLIPTALYIKKYFRYVIGGLIGLTVFWVICPMVIRYWGYQDIGNTYTSHDRFNNFLIGITFGAVMRIKKEKPYIFSTMMNLLLWLVVIVVSLAFNIFWFDVEYHYSLEKYTLFMGLYRPVWCSCLVFMVYSCYHNQGGIIQWFLTRPSFQILGRLAYSMYVLHVIVELYAGLRINTPSYFTNYMLFYNWCGHIIVTMVLSVFWVLAFEFPMLTIDKYLLDGEWLNNIRRKPQMSKHEEH